MTRPVSSFSASTDKDRGDIILNPLDDRCPYWGPAEELRRKAEARAIAASLYQPTNDKKGRILYRNAAEDLRSSAEAWARVRRSWSQWMSDPAEIEERVAGTEMEH